jgi:hypothetical protein
MPAPRQPTIRPAEDPEREERIDMEIVVDCYNESERASGWFCYLEDRLDCPFEAECVGRKTGSPLKPGDRVTVVGLIDAEDSGSAFAGLIDWKGDELAIPLSQLRAVNAPEKLTEALADWRYWVARGYEF